MNRKGHSIRWGWALCLLALLLPLSVLGKKDSVFYQERMPSSERMEELREGPPYDRFFEKEKGDMGERSLWTSIRTFLDEYFFSPMEDAASGPVLQYILIVLGIGLVITYFIRNGAVHFLRGSAVREGAGVTPFTALDLEEEGPLRKAREAERKGSLIEALRWRYIFIVQTLGRKGLIRKSPHRTDREYFMELKGTGLEEPFLKLSNAFQLVHYGDRPIRDEDYEGWKEDFEELERRIERYEG